MADTTTTDTNAFNFDAPGYYDFNDPSKENTYVNNADGYFNENQDPSFPEKENKNVTPYVALEEENLYSSSTKHETVSSSKTRRISLLSTDVQPPRRIRQSISSSPVKSDRRPTAIVKKKQNRVSSLMRPTSSYLAKHSSISNNTKPKRNHTTTQKKLTIPQSPKFHSRQKKHDDDASSTARELELIRKEVAELKLQKKRTEAYRKAASHRISIQKSNKPLTVPKSPHFTKHKKPSVVPETPPNAGHVQRPEEFLKRGDYDTTNANANHVLTTAKSPYLTTRIRAKSREAQHPPSPPAREKSSHQFNPLKLTMAQSPMLMTSVRAKNHTTYEEEKQEGNDEDGIELGKKFKAHPVNRSIFQNNPLENVRRAINQSKHELVIPESPKLATSLRSRATDVLPVSLKASSTTSTNRPLELTVAKTPKLKSLERHGRYKEAFEKQVLAEKLAEKKAREFKAQPMGTTARPRAIHSSDLPLTEIQPFSMPGDALHKAAVEKLKADKLATEAAIKNAAKGVKARPASALLQKVFCPTKSTKPLTSTDKAPVLASSVQASKRAAYDASDKARREAEAEAVRIAMLEKQKAEEQELARLRKTELTFHAAPIRGKNSNFKVNPSDKELTEPQSPGSAPRLL